SQSSETPAEENAEEPKQAEDQANASQSSETPAEENAEEPKQAEEQANASQSSATPAEENAQEPKQAEEQANASQSSETPAGENAEEPKQTEEPEEASQSTHSPAEEQSPEQAQGQERENASQPSESPAEESTPEQAEEKGTEAAEEPAQEQPAETQEGSDAEADAEGGSGANGEAQPQEESGENKDVPAADQEAPGLDEQGRDEVGTGAPEAAAASAAGASHENEAHGADQQDDSVESAGPAADEQQKDATGEVGELHGAETQTPQLAAEAETAGAEQEAGRADSVSDGCYVTRRQEVEAEAKKLLEVCERNDNFTKVDQQFCDELFKRIDGPFTVGEVSAFLRAADTANNISRNFRFCRATPTSSPPRVRDGDSVIHAAIAASKPRVVEILLQYGAFPNIEAFPRSPDAANRMGMRPLHYVARYPTLENYESLFLLLKYGSPVNVRDVGGRTPLMIAARSSHPFSKLFARALIDRNADVTARDKAGLSALHYAAASNSCKLVKLLINRGADVMSQDIRGNTPLHYAAAFNADKSMNTLLNLAGNAIKVNVPNKNGKAPIHLAAAPSSFDVVPAKIVPALSLELLLEKHADPVARDAHGNTPLMDAVLGGYLEIAKRLLQIARVPLHDKNMDGKTALDLAQEAAERTGDDVLAYLTAVSSKPSCPFIPRVANSIHVLSDTQFGSLMRVGDTVTYECHHGFRLLGHATLTCMSRDGSPEFIPDPPVCIPMEQGAASSLYSAPLGLATALLVYLIPFFLTQF
ncbi:rhoptry neck protein RON9, partial [Toxoplasma gondii FOU]